jgi:hypothetical protein
MADFFMNDNFCDVLAYQRSIESTQVAKINPNVNGKRCMVDNLVLEAEIQKLVAEGRGSQFKQKLAINKLSRLLSDHRHFLAGRLASSPCLDEAWITTLSHCLVNFWAVPADDNRTGSAYCDSPNIVYRIRRYFKHRIEDLEKRKRGISPNKQPLPLSLDAQIREDDTRALGDSLPAPQKDEDFDQLWELVEEDFTGELRAMTMKSQPALNAQKALLMFLAGYSARDIAKHFEVNEQTFNSFFKGKKNELQRDCCWKLLKRLWDEQHS